MITVDLLEILTPRLPRSLISQSMLLDGALPQLPPKVITFNFVVNT